MDRRDKWLKALDLKNWNPCKTAAVCSAHFKEDDYESSHSKKKLKIDAIPHVRIKNNTYLIYFYFLLTYCEK